MQKGDLIIVAGETSQGKTAFAVSIIRNIIQHGYKAAAYSLEMTHRQLTARIMDQLTGIPSRRIQTGTESSVSLVPEEDNYIAEIRVNEGNLVLIYMEFMKQVCSILIDRMMNFLL